MHKNFHHSFVFLDWSLDPVKHKLYLNYNIEEVGKVTEVLTFPAFEIDDTCKQGIDSLCELIHLLCGVSYYKAGLATDIQFKNNISSELRANFIKKTWLYGLAEMAFENQVSLKHHINIPFSEVKVNNSIDSHQLMDNPVNSLMEKRSLVALGGGKDSLVTIEELKARNKTISLFMVGNSQLIKDVAQFIGLPLIQVKRKIDDKLIQYNKSGKGFNGHVPITAINSAIAVLTALLLNFNEVVFSNEKSADSANTFNSDGDEVNHQYSKSYEFEKDFSEIISKEIITGVNYYSLQRQFTELEILEKFSHYPQYFSVFSSCNRNFHIDGSQNKQGLWCCDCPKCRFVFLGLAPYVKKQQLLNIFKHNLLNDETQKQGFSELLGLKGFKPFECVGEIAESQQAFSMIINSPEWQDDNLVKYFIDEFIRVRVELKINKEFNSTLTRIGVSLSHIKNKKIAIWGFGVEGQATARYLQRNGIDFKVLCGEKEVDDEFNCLIARVDKTLLDGFDLVIKSPGISPYTDLVKNANCEFTSPTAIWFANEEIPKVISVTGTKGKSTTVSLLAHVLDFCGYSVNLVGNIGKPLISADSKVDYIVLEASSFQIYDGNIQSEIAVVTNLYAEHVDWHAGKDNYFKDKIKILDNAKVKIINANNLKLNQLVKNNDLTYFNTITGFHVVDDKLMCASDLVLKLSEISLIGKHNLENIGAVLSVCKELELNILKCIEAIKSFKPLAHRLQNLGKIGLHYAINDSIATTPIATLAALETFDLATTTLLIGGYDRGNDWLDFVQALNNNPPNLLIISGQNAEVLKQLLLSLDTEINFMICINLKESIKMAQECSQEGDTILLSPGAPSFDQFDSYIKRGEFFEEELRSHV